MKDALTGKEISQEEFREMRFRSEQLRKLDEINNKLSSGTSCRTLRPEEKARIEQYKKDEEINKDRTFYYQSQFVDMLTNKIVCFQNHKNLVNKMKELESSDQKFSASDEEYLLVRLNFLLNHNDIQTKTCLAIKNDCKKSFNVFHWSSDRNLYIYRHLDNFNLSTNSNLTNKQYKKYEKKVIKNIMHNYKSIAKNYLEAYNQILKCTFVNELAAFFVESICNKKINTTFDFGNLYFFEKTLKYSFTKNIKKSLKKCAKTFNHIENPYSKAYKLKIKEENRKLMNKADHYMDDCSK